MSFNYSRSDSNEVDLSGQKRQTLNNGPDHPRPDGSNEDVTSGKKRQKSTSVHNCAECRRTKSKCNRSWPCSECVRKGLEDLCPDRVSSTALPKTQTIALLTDRVKDLEEKLRRLGQDVESDPLLETIEAPNAPQHSGRNGGRASGPASTNGETPMPARPHDMTAMLSRLALGPTTAKRYAGTEASPFYLSIESDDEDDEKGVNSLSGRSKNAETLIVPWAHGGESSLGRMGDMPGVLLDRCRELLPKKSKAKDIWQRFWDNTSWRIQPILPSYFHDTILVSVYDSAGPHPHQLAVLFAVTAISTLLDPTLCPSSITPREYHETAYSCLVAGKFFTDTTLDSLITLSLIGTYTLNADDKKAPDANFAVFGLGLRLAIIAGYHRDPALLYQDISLDEMDQRRRIFHELLASDRLHCMPALLPNSIDTSHYDTKLPSDADPKGYFVWKWTVGVQISRVVDYWTSTRIPPYTTLQEIDAGIRRMLHALPDDLRTRHLPAEAFPLDRPGAPAVLTTRKMHDGLAPQASSGQASEETLTRQRIRLAMHFCMLFFYLHRPCFMRALVAGDTTMELSVQTMIEVCSHVVTLTGMVMSLDSTVSRWFSFAADLFSVLHCQTVLIVKTANPADVQPRMTLLETGVEILQWNASLQNNPKNRALVNAARKLLTNAQQSQQANPEPTFSFSPLWQDFVNTANLGFDVGPSVGPSVMGGGQPVSHLQSDMSMGWQDQVHGQVGFDQGQTHHGGGGLDEWFSNLLEPNQGSNSYQGSYSQF